LSISKIKRFLGVHSLSPSRDLGQNFLVDEDEAASLVRWAGVGPQDAVIEIGTGLGILTHALAQVARRVISVEIDSGLVRAHQAAESFAEFGDKVHLIHADAREFDFAQAVEELKSPVKVVANLPYSVSTPLLRQLLDARHELVSWSVMLQRELADRLLAQPSTRDYGSLTVLHHLLVEVEHGRDLDEACFYPAPKVVSSFIRIRPLDQPLLGDAEVLWVERVLRAAFGKRRKTLSNSLRAFVGENGGDSALVAEILEGLGLDSRVRAEALMPTQLLAIARILGERLSVSQKEKDENLDRDITHHLE